LSIRRDPRSPFWSYNFQLQNRRFFGSTKKTVRREAEVVERAERERAKLLIAQVEHARTSLRLDDVAGRYWQEHGQHLAGANMWGLLGLLLGYFGKDKRITEITDDDVVRLVAWRRGHRSRTRNLGHEEPDLLLRSAEIAATGQSLDELHGTFAGGGALISPHTVNTTTVALRRLFTHCKLWGVRFAHEPKWSRHLLKVPAERVRELSDDEADKLDAVTRDDLAPFFVFARASGLRLRECLLRWSEVEGKQIVKLGKGGKRVSVPVTSEIADILRPLRGHHPEFVFTFVAQRTRTGRVRGQRYPLTYAGVRTAWRRLRARSGVSNFRFHDLRHDFATKLLRETGNLRLVQKALGHASIKTTTRYAHVLDHEVADAMERMSRNRKLRTGLRTKLKVV
jgi:integrase